MRQRRRWGHHWGRTEAVPRHVSVLTHVREGRLATSVGVSIIIGVPGSGMRVAALAHVGEPVAVIGRSVWWWRRRILLHPVTESLAGHVPVVSHPTTVLIRPEPRVARPVRVPHVTRWVPVPVLLHVREAISHHRTGSRVHGPCSSREDEPVFARVLHSVFPGVTHSRRTHVPKATHISAGSGGGAARTTCPGGRCLKPRGLGMRWCPTAWRPHTRQTRGHAGRGSTTARGSTLASQSTRPHLLLPR